MLQPNVTDWLRCTYCVKQKKQTNNNNNNYNKYLLTGSSLVLSICKSNVQMSSHEITKEITFAYVIVKSVNFINGNVFRCVDF